MTAKKNARKKKAAVTDPVLSEVVAAVEESGNAVAGGTAVVAEEGGAAARGEAAVEVVQHPTQTLSKSAIEEIIRRQQAGFSVAVQAPAASAVKEPVAHAPTTPVAVVQDSAVATTVIHTGGEPPPRVGADIEPPTIEETMLPFDGSLIPPADRGAGRATIVISAPPRTSFQVNLIYMHATLRRNLIVEDILVSGVSCLKRPGAHSAEAYDFQQVPGTTPQGITIQSEATDLYGRKIPAQNLEIRVRNLGPAPQYAIGQVYGSAVTYSEKFVAAMEAHNRKHFGN